MLTVAYKGQSEPLTHIAVGSYQKRWELNGELSLSLDSLDVSGNPGHALLQEGAVITTVDGLDFRVLQITSTRYGKSVGCLSTFYDLGGVIKHEIFGGTKTLREFTDWILTGTGWTADIVDVTQSALIANFGNGENALKLIEQLLAAYECEREILPGNVIRFAKQIGPSNDRQFRVGHNAQGIKRTVNTTDVRTSITGYGGGGLTVKYVSPHADKFPDRGEAEPIKDERYTIQESLLDRLKQELNDTPAITVEVDTLEVGNVEPGETVWVIDDRLDMMLETRVIAGEESDPERPRYGRVTLGNTIKRKLEDALTETEIDMNDKIDDVNDSVEDYRRQSETKFEQTNEYIRATATALEEYTDEQMGAVRREMEAEFIVTAEAITSSVRESKTYTDAEVGKVQQDMSSQFNVMAGRINAKADSTTVNSLGTRVNNVEWDLDAVEGQITQKVSKTDYNGETIVSMVNQTAERYKISARNIELEGITEVSGNLRIGARNNYQKKLEFPLDPYGYSANIVAELYGGLSGMSLNASYIGINSGNELDIGGPSNSKVNASGNWNFTGNVTGITGVAVLG